MDKKRKEVFFFACICLSPYLYLLLSSDLPSRFLLSILLNLGMSILAFMATFRLIPVVSQYMLKRDLFGFDVNKKGTPAGTLKVPESMGLIAGIVYLVIAISFWRLFVVDSFLSSSSPSHLSLQEFNVAFASICFMLFLGFVDDVLDIPWRIKLLLPAAAAMLLVMAYSGGTTVLIPKPFNMFFGIRLLDLGWVYKLCIGFLVVFCTNAVNIFAGINGLEAGQTIVIACSILTFNLVNIISASADLNTDQQLAHMFSIHLTQPLTAVSFGLLSFNWYPSTLFVGDSFTYFAGMTLAVVAIFGHFSETLCFFMMPQILNFVYSLPQLLKMVPCPRHRLPRFDPKSGLLTGSNDMNLINLFLRLFGRCSEYSLFIKLMLFQVICCISTMLSQVDVSTISIADTNVFERILAKAHNIMVMIPQTIILMWLVLMFLACTEKSSVASIFTVLPRLKHPST